MKKAPKTLFGYGTEGQSVKQIFGVQVDRLSDVEGVGGDVTDVRVEFFSEGNAIPVNISLKHMHTALKHPRLTRVPQWIGKVDPRKAREYEVNYEGIWSSFFKKCNEILPAAQRFREVKAVEPDSIEKHLYKPLYALVRDFLSENTNSPTQVVELFDFLVGKYEYIKFINHDDKIEIRDFSNIPKPQTVKITYSGTGYLQFNFSNGWKLSGRLHTASKWLSKKPIKFDVQPRNLDELVPAIYIPIGSNLLA